MFRGFRLEIALGHPPPGKGAITVLFSQLLCHLLSCVSSYPEQLEGQRGAEGAASAPSVLRLPSRATFARRARCLRRR